MKKILSFLLAVAMMTSMVACGGGDQGVSSDDIPPAENNSAPATDTTKPADDTTAPSDVASGDQEVDLSKLPISGQLIVGSDDMNSDFMGGWTNLTPNARAKTIMYGYSPVTLTREEKFDWDNTVLKKQESKLNDDKSKTYTITINDNLVYNNGDPIKAKDYVFNILLSSSPEFAALEADATSGSNFVGYEDFNSGKTKTFSGIHLIDDYTYSIDIAADKLPFFYEISYLSGGPIPMSILAPGADITDDGSGATFSENFTVDLIREPITNTSTGYRYAPKVTCGPYSFESYDPATKQGVFVANEKFLGDYTGATPHIQKIIFKTSPQSTAMDELASGSVDLLPGKGGGEIINAGLDLVDQGKSEYKTYDRSGYGQIKFSCDFGPTQFKAVRQAIAYCLDREEFARQYSGGYAKVVNARYGLSQWMYKENKDAVEKELNPYSYNIDKAKEVLDADGWNLDEAGKPYVEGAGKIRYKDVDGTLMPCIIEWANLPDNVVSSLLNTMLPTEMEKAGMKLNATTLEFGVQQNNIYRQGIDKPKYHMYNMGTNFGIPDSPWYDYSPDPKFKMYNTNYIVDEELNRIVQDMKTTEPGDEASFSKKWLEYVKCWNELLPNIPLYSDEYYDFYNPKLKNYNPGPVWSWDYDIVYCYIEE